MERRNRYNNSEREKSFNFSLDTIIKVAVKSGDKVEPGDLLMIFEAMKMQNLITMPFDGKIKSINVKPDDKLPRSFLMIEIA